MKILYVGDVMAKPGRQLITDVLPKIKKELNPDFVIVQAENSNEEGKGPGKQEVNEMLSAGADFFTGGNHSLRGQNSEKLYEDLDAPIVRPANINNAPGSGWKIIDTGKGKILIASILGQTVGRQQPDITNPLEVIDKILEDTKDEQLAAKIVNFHGDFSSEKRVFGYYTDGRLSAVIGDHWHVPTADAMVLPKGTAHITDVGMCGTLHSSIGVKTEVIIERWKTGVASQNEIETRGPRQFNAVLVDVDEADGLAKSIEAIHRVYPS